MGTQLILFTTKLRGWELILELKYGYFMESSSNVQIGCSKEEMCMNISRLNVVPAGSCNSVRFKILPFPKKK